MLLRIMRQQLITIVKPLIIMNTGGTTAVRSMLLRLTSIVRGVMSTAVPLTLTLRSDTERAACRIREAAHKPDLAEGLIGSIGLRKSISPARVRLQKQVGLFPAQEVGKKFQDRAESGRPACRSATNTASSIGRSGIRPSARHGRFGLYVRSTERCRMLRRSDLAPNHEMLGLCFLDQR
jgi:hypothetical protein